MWREVLLGCMLLPTCPPPPPPYPTTQGRPRRLLRQPTASSAPAPASWQAEQLLAQHGYNEVKAKQTAEWKKIAWRCECRGAA